VTDLVDDVVAPAATAGGGVLTAEEVARRLRVGHLLAVVLYVLALGAAILAAIVVVELTDGSPMAVVRAVHAGSFETWPAVGQTLDQAAPLALVALGTVVTNRAGLVNIGQEGQVLVGGLAGVAVGLHVDGPRAVVVPLVLLAAAAGGALWAGVAAALRYGRRVNEVISTLLLIYVAYQLVTWMVTREYLLRESRAAAGQSNDQTSRLTERAQLPHFGRFDELNVNLGIVIAVVVVAVGGFLLARSRFGFRLRVLGHNPAAAQRAGVSTTRTGTAALLIGGALAGFAGGILLTGTVFRVSSGFANNFGWQGLLVALIARNRPGAVLVVALFFGALRNSTLALAASGTPRDIVDVVQALLVLGAILPPVYLTVRERRLRRQLATARA
jgi:general nucleoside transport system permease protein